MKCQISLPDPSIIPNTVSSGSGGASCLMRDPRSRPSNGRERLDPVKL
jgi:hypothetical protein